MKEEGEKKCLRDDTMPASFFAAYINRLKNWGIYVSYLLAFSFLLYSVLSKIPFWCLRT